jgi:hypothetical protein
MHPNSDLPASVAQLARVIGRDQALALAGSCQNGRIYVPRSPGPNHRLTQLIGQEAAGKIARQWGGEIIYMAKCHEVKIKFRNSAIRRWAAEGRTRRELADLAGLTERQIDNILHEKSSPMDAVRARGNVQS